MNAAAVTRAYYGSSRWPLVVLLFAIAAPAHGADSDLASRVEALEARVSALENLLAQERNGSSVLGNKDRLWGASPRDMDVLLVAAQRHGDALVVDGDVGGLPARTGYRFSANRLTEIRISFQSGDAFRDEEWRSYTSHYQRLRGMLSQKYGAPARDDQLWSNDLLRDDPARIGQALAVGHVRWLASWKSAKTYVALLLFGGGQRLHLEAVFLPLQAQAPDAKELWNEWMAKL